MALFWAILAGLFMPIQGALNARLSFTSHHPLMGAWVSFIVGALFSTFMLFIYPKPLHFKSLQVLPWWSFMGGVLGVGFVLVATILMPKLGALQVMMSFLIGQVIMSLIMDQFGLFGHVQIPINLSRIMGVLFIVIGFFLVVKKYDLN